MKPAIDSAPIFLRIQWEAEQEAGGTTVVREAFLCKFHRQEIALSFPSARGCGHRAESCDFCEERSKKGRSGTPGIRGSGD